MSVYVKEFVKGTAERFEGRPAGEIVGELFRIGIIDHTLCKVLAIRSHVGKLVGEGMLKIDAMWETSEVFSCTYEYVRKCMYYYTDINYD